MSMKVLNGCSFCQLVICLVSDLQNAEKLDLMRKAISAHTTYTKEVNKLFVSNRQRKHKNKILIP